MTLRPSSLPIVFATLGLSLSACEEKATDADLVSLAERIAVLESQVGDVSTDDGQDLAERVTALEDDLGEAQVDIVESTTLISENQVDIALNEEAILDVEGDLALAEADIAENESAISEANVAIAALEASVAALEATLATLDADLLALADEVGDNADAIDLLQDAYTDVLTQITDIDLAIAAIDVTAITELVDGVSEDLADMETDLDADIAAVEADVADLQGRGEVWLETGSGTGTCAQATVTTTSDRPLMVFAAVEASAVGSDGCSAAGSTSSFNICPASTSGLPAANTLGGSGIVTIDAENASGSWVVSESRTEQASYDYRPGYNTYTWGSAAGVGGWATYETGYLSINHDWTVPLNTVLDIPSAGTYIIDLGVSGFSGDCTLVVVQP